ncbi:MAG: DUF559 domain-containing protein [Pseudomonadota bacterium]
MRADPVIRARAKHMRRSMTNAETILWSRLRRRQLDGWLFRRQHPIDRYIADFACPKAKLVVEVDGATHGSDDEIAYDRRRTSLMETEGWRVHRVCNTDIYENLNSVLDSIIAHLPENGAGRRE